jgi:uncharacterized membrane protein YoaK (UPF0700 family)
MPGLPKETAVGALLAFIAGFADASTFVGAQGVFCAHVTGNFVVLAADLARGAGKEEWLKLATFPIFVATVLAVTAVHRKLKLEPPATTRRLLLTKAVLFAAAAALGLAAGAPPAGGAARTAIVALLVVAMGVQNAMHRIHGKLGPMTTVMTGNVTQLLSDSFVAGTPEAHARRKHLGAVILAFAIGCAAGAVSVWWIGFAMLLVPALAALGARTLVPVEPSVPA